MNKFFIKTLTLFGGVLILLGAVSPALAYTRASLHVNDVVLDKDTYSPGEEVTGSFLVINSSNFGVNDANYVVSLGADYGDRKSPTDIIDTSGRNKIPFLRAGAEKTIDFSYTLPLVAGGDDLGIHVRAVLDSGMRLGWDDATFDISGESLSLVKVKDSSISVLDKMLSIGTGPTIYPEDGSKLILELNSPEDLLLTPSVTIRSQFDNEIVYDTELEEVSVSAGALKYEFELPTEFSPGVYLGKFEMLDPDGVNRISKVEFRYVIGGQIGTIQGIYTDKNSVEEGGVLGVSVNVTGTPTDIVRGGVPVEEKNAKLDVIVKDTITNEVVGGETINIEELVNKTYDIDILVEEDIENITVETVLYGSNDQMLDDYSVTQPEEELPGSDMSIWVSLAIAIVVIVILLIIGIVVKRLKEEEVVE